MDALTLVIFGILAWLGLTIASNLIGLIIRRYAWPWAQAIRLGWLWLCTRVLPCAERDARMAWLRSYLDDQLREQRQNGSNPSEVAIDVLRKLMMDAPGDLSGVLAHISGKRIFVKVVCRSGVGSARSRDVLEVVASCPLAVTLVSSVDEDEDTISVEFIEPRPGRTLSEIMDQLADIDIEEIYRVGGSVIDGRMARFVKRLRRVPKGTAFFIRKKLRSGVALVVVRKLLNEPELAHVISRR